MMETKTIRAVYENGVFRPLSEVNLKEEEEVEILIKPKNLTKATKGIVRSNVDLSKLKYEYKEFLLEENYEVE